MRLVLRVDCLVVGFWGATLSKTFVEAWLATIFGDAPHELAGAPEQEIEITPAMMDAGAAVLCGFETEITDETYWAKAVKVYVAMRKAA